MSLGLLVALVLVTIQLVVVFGFVLLERRQPAATLAWLLAVMLLPGVGILLYLILGMPRMRRAHRRTEQISARIAELIRKYRVGSRLSALEDPTAHTTRTRAMLALGRTVASTPATTGNETRILVNAAATYRSMIAAIEAATDHIHVEFYIIQPDDTGRNLRQRLVRKARDGVEVRVVCDALGSMSLPDDFWNPLVEVGGQFAWFSPVNPLYRFRRRDRVDFRNHRKIVVVDGHVGFTGGINVGREYLGLDPDVGHWRDTHIRIAGPAVLGLQESFAEDWLAASGELLDDPRYFPEPVAADGAGDIVQIVDSGPDRSWSPMQRIHVQAIAFAERRAWVTSPYFVPDAVMEEALVTAALRGVDVRLLLPAKSDHALVRWATAAYYPKLLEAGIRVFEYARGFVHAKTLVVDDWVGTVGSANMDIRSFHLNWELNAFVFGEVFCKELEREFLEDLRNAHEVSLDEVRRLPYLRRILQASARLLSPLL